MTFTHPYSATHTLMCPSVTIGESNPITPLAQHTVAFESSILRNFVKYESIEVDPCYLDFVSITPKILLLDLDVANFERAISGPVGESIKASRRVEAQLTSIEIAQIIDLMGHTQASIEWALEFPAKDQTSIFFEPAMLYFQRIQKTCRQAFRYNRLLLDTLQP